MKHVTLKKCINVRDIKLIIFSLFQLRSHLPFDLFR